MMKQIFLSVLVTLSFLFSLNNVKAQTNVPSQVCGRFAQLSYYGSIPPGATAYWIDSLNNVINWWQVVNQTTGNGPNTIAEVANYGQNAFAFVIHDGANYDTSAWSTVTFIQKPMVDACPSCYMLEDATLDNVNGQINSIHLGSVRTDTICFHDNSSFYILNPACNIGQPQWSKSINGIDFANAQAPGYTTNVINDTIYASVFNSEEGNSVGDFYLLVFRSQNTSGCASSDTLLLSIAKQPTGMVEFRRPFCHGQEALVWASLDNEANPTIFDWNFGANANIINAVTDVTTPDSVYSVNWGNNNDCDNLIHQVSLMASSSWGCTSSVNMVYIEEPPLVMPLINITQPDCGQANGKIKIQNDTLVACDDTLSVSILHRWMESTIYDFDSQTNNGANAVVDSLYNISSQDTSWLEISYISLVTYDTGYVGPQIMCKDTVDIVLDDCTFIFHYKNEYEVSVYPNPTIESITIEVNNNELIMNNEAVTITDLTGKIVKTSDLHSDNFTLNVSELKPGVYILKVGNTVQKFIKE